MMDRFGVKVHAERVDYGTRLDLYILSEPGNGKRGLAQPVVFETVAENDEPIEGPRTPTVSISQQAAQNLFEALWDMGFRSPRDRGSIDTLDAARLAHIEDLRRAAFDAVNVAMPGRP